MVQARRARVGTEAVDGRGHGEEVLQLREIGGWDPRGWEIGRGRGRRGRGPRDGLLSWVRGADGAADQGEDHACPWKEQERSRLRLCAHMYQPAFPA